MWKRRSRAVEAFFSLALGVCEKQIVRTFPFLFGSNFISISTDAEQNGCDSDECGRRSRRKNSLDSHARYVSDNAKFERK